MVLVNELAYLLFYPFLVVFMTRFGTVCSYNCLLNVSVRPSILNTI